MTALPLLPPALSRALGHYVLDKGASFDLALHLSFWAAEVIVVAPLAHDARGGKVRAPYLVLLAVLLVQQGKLRVGDSVRALARSGGVDCRVVAGPPPGHSLMLRQ